jgi:hypothetical protein
MNLAPLKNQVLKQVKSRVRDRTPMNLYANRFMEQSLFVPVVRQTIQVQRPIQIQLLRQIIQVQHEP